MAAAVPPGGTEPLGLQSQRVRERDHLRVGHGPIQQSLGDAQLPVEDPDRQLGQRVRLPQVRSQAAAQVAAGVRSQSLRPRGLHEGTGIPELERQPAALRSLRRCEVGIAEPDRCRAAECEGLAEPTRGGRGVDAVQRVQGSSGIAQLELGQRLLRPEFVGFRLADELCGGCVRRGCSTVAERIEDLRTEAARFPVLGHLLQERLKVAEGIGERAERDGLAGRGQQPVDRLVRTTAVQPVPGDQDRRSARGGQAASRIAVHREPLVRWDLLDEGLADQLVPETVAGTRDGQRSGLEAGIQHRERVGLGQPGQRQHAGRIDVVAGHCEPAQHPDAGLIEVEEPRGDRLPDRSGDRQGFAGDDATGQLDSEEGIALCRPDDLGEYPGVRLRRCGGLHQRGDVIVIQRAEIDPDGSAGPVQAGNPLRQRRSGELRTVGEDGKERAPTAGPGEMHTRFGRRVVGEVRVVDDEHHPGGVLVPARHEQPANGADHHVPGEPALAGLCGCGQQCQLGQRGARPVRKDVEQGVVAAEQLLDSAHQGCVRVAPDSRHHRDDQPRPLPRRRGDLAAQGGLADASRPAHHQCAHLALLGGPQRDRRPGEFDLAADERRRGAAEPCDALLVQCLTLRARRHTELALQVRAEPSVPADRGMPVATGQLSAHQLSIRCLVGRLDLDEPVPLSAEPQELDVERSQVVPPRLRPLFVQRFRKQVAGIAGRGFGAGSTIPGAQRHLGRPLEALDVSLQMTRREQHDPAAAQHHGLLTTKRLPGMVSGLAEIGGARLGTQVRPQGLDDLLPCKTVTIGQGEKLHQLRGPPSRPRGVRHLLACHADSKGPEQLDAHAVALRMGRHHDSYRVAGRQLEHNGSTAAPPAAWTLLRHVHAFTRWYRGERVDRIMRTGWSAGRWPSTCTPSWPSTRSPWPCSDVSPPKGSAVTATAAARAVHRRCLHQGAGDGRRSPEHGLGGLVFRQRRLRSFLATLKTELVHTRTWPTRQAARTAIDEYLEVFYNRRRRHSALDYLSPTEYERRHHHQPATLVAA
jgi:Integrase core domain